MAETPQPLRVLLCDDAVAYSAIVARWISAADGVELIGAVDTAALLFEVAPSMAPDVILLDIVLPDGDSDARRVARLREMVPGVRIVVVSGTPPDALARTAQAMGADSSCSKATGPDELVAAIRGG